MAKRKIIKIDEAKCDGCGLCVPNCPEGALQVIDKKAKIISDLFCDGLGACIGHCPKGAITIEEREAEEFDERKVEENMGKHRHDMGCPGSKIMDFRRKEEGRRNEKAVLGSGSELRQWPVQIMLVPPFAPYLNNADLLIAADCVPFAYADFHQDLLKDKILLVGCPKLDDTQVYQDKLNRVLQKNNIKSITYAHMEVPCCFGLVSIIKEAIAHSGKNVPFKEAVISIKGERIK